MHMHSNLLLRYLLFVLLVHIALLLPWIWTESIILGPGPLDGCPTFEFKKIKGAAQPCQACPSIQNQPWTCSWSEHCFVCFFLKEQTRFKRENTIGETIPFWFCTAPSFWNDVGVPWTMPYGFVACIFCHNWLTGGILQWALILSTGFVVLMIWPHDFVGQLVQQLLHTFSTSFQQHRSPSLRFIMFTFFGRISKTHQT